MLLFLLTYRICIGGILLAHGYYKNDMISKCLGFFKKQKQKKKKTDAYLLAYRMRKLRKHNGGVTASDDPLWLFCLFANFFFFPFLHFSLICFFYFYFFRFSWKGAVISWLQFRPSSHGKRGDVMLKTRENTRHFPFHYEIFFVFFPFLLLLLLLLPSPPHPFAITLHFPLYFCLSLSVGTNKNKWEQKITNSGFAINECSLPLVPSSWSILKRYIFAIVLGKCRKRKPELVVDFDYISFFFSFF